MGNVITMRGILIIASLRQHLPFNPSLSFNRALVYSRQVLKEAFRQTKDHALSDAVVFTTPPQRPPSTSLWPEMSSPAVAIDRPAPEISCGEKRLYVARSRRAVSES